MHQSPPFMILGHVKLICYFQSMFNRQVLTSTGSMRFLARIKRKKVRIMMMSTDVIFPSKLFFPWFCRIQSQANLILIYIFVGKLSYSRNFLISLANCAESRKKPEFLPEYSIVLTKAVSLESALFKMFVQLYWIMSQIVWAERRRTLTASRNVVEWRKRKNVSFKFRTQWLYITLTFIVLISLFLLFLGRQKGLSHCEKLYKNAP